MDGTLGYPRSSERRVLARPASGIPLLFSLADCCDEQEQIQVGNVTENAKFIEQSAGSFFVSPRQVKFVCGIDNHMPYLDYAVDYAEQL